LQLGQSANDEHTHLVDIMRPKAVLTRRANPNDAAARINAVGSGRHPPIDGQGKLAGIEPHHGAIQQLDRRRFIECQRAAIVEEQLNPPSFSPELVALDDRLVLLEDFGRAVSGQPGAAVDHIDVG
jgi:hypothetical protein